MNLNSEPEEAVDDPPPCLTANAIGGSLIPKATRMSEKAATIDRSIVKPSSLGEMTADWALNLYSHELGNMIFKGTSSTIDPVLGKSNNRTCLPSLDPVRFALSDHPHGWSTSTEPIPISRGVSWMWPVEEKGARSKEQQPPNSPFVQVLFCSRLEWNWVDSNEEIKPSPSPKCAST